ncbi:MAG: hypothetical protein PHY48_10460 [Candidatus Cloacimonetes bacterium]|nr:hypothetical protein [Candidatus Cloacimonadota bacterium]
MNPFYYLLIGILLPVIPVYCSIVANGKKWAGKSSPLHKKVILAISRSHLYDYLAQLGISSNIQISIIDENEIIIKMNPCLSHSGLVYRLLISTSDVMLKLEIHGFTSWYLPQNFVIRKHLELFADRLKLLELANVMITATTN